MGMFEARECQPEVVQPMLQYDAHDHDAERTRVGEVGEAKTTGLVLLAEDDILLRAGKRPPSPHAPLQRAPHAGTELGMAPPDLFQYGNSADAGRRLHDRHDLGVPNVGQRIGPPPATRHLLLRGQPRIILDPVTTRRREAGLGGGDRGRVGLSETHV